MASETVADTRGTAPPATSLTPLETAEELLVAFKTDRDPTQYLSALAGFSDDDLAAIRADRDRALAFWCNLYNAGTQQLLDTRSSLYESRLRALRFFRVPAVTVAGHALTLDDIEHGIIRGRSKYGLGYLPRFVPDTFELRHRLPEVDPRIHFALNCGAASCPAIRAYTPDRIDDQLDLAAETYLDATAEYDPGGDVVRVTPLFRWYRGDFGGSRGVTAFLRRYDVVPAGADPTVRYQSWDWTQRARKFVDG